jgi:hypothetical protein
MLQYAVLLLQQDKEETHFHLDVRAFLEVGWGEGDKFLCQFPKICPKKFFF